MKKAIKIILVVIVILISGYYFLGYMSSYVGWQMFKKWTNRVGTIDIEDSKKRGVFVKELPYRIDSFSGNPSDLDNFKPYIERGFRYGEHTSEETLPLINSKYPYQLSFNYSPTQEISIFIRKAELRKFDSSNGTWGYLRRPELRDTIILNIRGENISGNIKVW